MRLKLSASIRYQVLFLFSCLSVLLFAEPVKTVENRELKPSLSEAVSAVNTVQILSHNAYNKLPLDKTTSNQFFNAYIDSLDPQHVFFQDSDLKSFHRYRNTILQSLRSGQLTPGFIIYSKYQLRYEAFLKYQIALIEKGVDKIDLNSKRRLSVDRKNSVWPADIEAQHLLWRDQLANNIISMMLNSKSKQTIAEQLKRRYSNQLHRLPQIHAEDVFQLYMNAFTMLYDPHTQFFSPSKMQNFNIDMSLSLEGIGAVLQSDGNYTKIVSVVPGGPADKAGQLKPGDKILGVAQGKSKQFEDVTGMRLDDVVKLIRGKKGSAVSLEVSPAEQERETRIYYITRDKVKLEEQAAKANTFMAQSGGRQYKLGVVHIPAFYQDFKAAQAGERDYKSTTRDVRRLLTDLGRQHVDGVIIDLRNNGGGSLQESIDLTGLFIPKGPTVIVSDSKGNAEPQMDTDGKAFYAGPLVLMINRMSASASEIFAGAMKDYNRAVIVGSQSFGKGTVQTLQPLNGGQLKLTIAKFYRVSGKSTQHRGVMPDIRFPSFFDDKIGESMLPNALPWDTIKPVQHKKMPSLTDAISQLHLQHTRREKQLPYFQYIRRLQQLDKQYSEKKTISLNFKERKKEFDDIGRQQLAIENELRKTQGKKLLKTTEEIEKEQASILFSSARDDFKNDAYLQEAGNILADYINFKNK